MIGTSLLIAGLLAAANPALLPPRAEPARITNERGTAVIFSAARGGASAYISNRHALLDRLENESPSTRFEAQLSFTHRLTGEQILHLLGKSDARTVSLDFGWNGQRGGFDLRESESLEEGLSRLHDRHGLFISDMEDSKALVGEETQRENNRPQDGQRRRRHVEHVDSLSAAFRDHGVLFIGAKVTGTPAALQTLRNQSAAVRLVDPLWDELSDASGTAGIRKISIPLDPDSR